MVVSALYQNRPLQQADIEYHHMNKFRRGGNLLSRPPHEADIAQHRRYAIDGEDWNLIFLTGLQAKAEYFSSAQFTDRDSYYGTNQTECLW